MNKSNQTFVARIFLITATVIWGSTFFIIKDSLNGIHAITMVSYRSLLAATLLGIGLFFTKKNIWQNFFQGMILGLLLTILYICQTVGLYYTSASNSGFITGLVIVFVPIYALILWHQRPKIYNLIAVILTVIGLWFLTGGAKNLNKGDIITLFVAISGALHLLLVDKFIKNKLNIFILTFQQFLVMGIICLVIALIFNLPMKISTHEALFATLYLAIFANVISYLLQFYAQKHTSPHTVSIILTLEPAFAAVFAWTIGGETFSFNHLIGGIFIFTAIIFSAIFEKPSQKVFKREIIHEHF